MLPYPNLNFRKLFMRLTPQNIGRISKRSNSNFGYPDEQWSMVIMDCFKGIYNDTMFSICEKYLCLVPRNLTNKFQTQDIGVNRPAKAFISNKFNIWYSGIVRGQLSRGVSPKDVKVSMKLSELKPVRLMNCGYLQPYANPEGINC